MPSIYFLHNSIIPGKDWTIYLNFEGAKIYVMKTFKMLEGRTCKKNMSKNLKHEHLNRTFTNVWRASLWFHLSLVYVCVKQNLSVISHILRAIIHMP